MFVLIFKVLQKCYTTYLFYFLGQLNFEMLQEINVAENKSERVIEVG